MLIIIALSFIEYQVEMYFSIAWGFSSHPRLPSGDGDALLARVCLTFLFERR
jgi:hypothetical protein